MVNPAASASPTKTSSWTNGDNHFSNHAAGPPALGRAAQSAVLILDSSVADESRSPEPLHQSRSAQTVGRRGLGQRHYRGGSAVQDSLQKLVESCFGL